MRFVNEITAGVGVGSGVTTGGCIGVDSGFEVGVGMQPMTLKTRTRTAVITNTFFIAIPLYIAPYPEVATYRSVSFPVRS